MIDHLSSKFCAAAELACNVSIAETAAIIITRMTASQTTKCKQRDNAEDRTAFQGHPRTPGIKSAFCALLHRSIRSRSSAGVVEAKKSQVDRAVSQSWNFVTAAPAKIQRKPSAGNLGKRLQTARLP